MNLHTLTIRFLSGESVPVQWHSDATTEAMTEHLQRFLDGTVTTLGTVAINRHAIAMIEVQTQAVPEAPSTPPVPAMTEDASSV